jgi:hypothetical protein
MRSVYLATLARSWTSTQMWEIDSEDVVVANIKVRKFRKQVPEGLARSLWAKRIRGKLGDISAMAGARSRPSFWPRGERQHVPNGREPFSQPR